jgi:plastocyanin
MVLNLWHGAAVLAACVALTVPAPTSGVAHAGGLGQLGSIRGRVDVQFRPPAAVPDVDVTSLHRRHESPASDRMRAVVYLETAPRGAFEEPRDRRARMDQRNETFVPHVLAITVGTTVDFPNNDVTYHNVFSLSRPRPFDLGRYAVGRSRSVTFDRPGIVRVFCDIHSQMSAFILVFSHRFFDVTDDQGRYAIDEVPPGTYKVNVWNEAVTPVSRTVTVAAGGEVTLDVVLGEGS